MKKFETVIYCPLSMQKIGKIIFLTVGILILSFSSSCNFPSESPAPSVFPDANQVFTRTGQQIPLTTPSLPKPDEVEHQEDPLPASSPRPENTPDTRAPDEGCDYQAAFGIDYCQPGAYLAQGAQSALSDLSVLTNLQTAAKGLSQLEVIYQWLHSDFTAYSAGGRTIGVVTVDDLLQERRLGGCHDFGLVYAAAARELGYPAVMVRTDSIDWIKRFQEGGGQMHMGHVFVEVFLDGTWLLIDPTNGWYVEEGYDPAHPVIPLRGSIAGPNEEFYGFYVECKGIDIWDFGIHSQAESTQAMDDLALGLHLDMISYPGYTFQQFSR